MSAGYLKVSSVGSNAPPIGFAAYYVEALGVAPSGPEIPTFLASVFIEENVFYASLSGQ